MTVSRPSFPSPILCIDDFLSDDDAQQVLQECIDLRDAFTHATVRDSQNISKVEPRFRKNDVVRLDDIFEGAPERSATLTLLKKAVWSEPYQRLWHEGDYIFDVINESTWQEAVISRYGNSGFYMTHRDTRGDHPAYRLVTLVYFVNRLPAQFSGGSLMFWRGGNSLKLEPIHNRAVVFPSSTFHEVEDVHLDSNMWEDGRFSVNFWLGFR